MKMLEKENKDSVPLLFIALIVACITLIVKLLIYVKVWTLVAVPLGAPQIGMLQAYGISLLTSFFSSEGLVTKKEDDKYTKAQASILRSMAGVLTSLVAWGFAYLFFG